MKPKKSLGQNFLRDKTILDKIIETADLSADDFVIEIGPGEGVLTEQLSKCVNKIIAIEIDNYLAENLKKKLGNYENLEIINDDILKINLPETISQFESTNDNESTNKSFVNSNSFVDSHRYKVIANIPYYITSPIIQLFLETKYPPREMILMVQKEVAERIVAKPGEMSILAASVQYYADAELLFYVDKKAFWPVPEVDSAVIKISVNSEQETANKKGEAKKFFRVVKAGFASRRKTLLNNLSSSFHLDKAITEEKIKKAGINPGVRAQELSVEDWKKLSSSF